jgi:hypothetical protein
VRLPKSSVYSVPALCQLLGLVPSGRARVEQRGQEAAGETRLLLRVERCQGCARKLPPSFRRREDRQHLQRCARLASAVAAGAVLIDRAQEVAPAGAVLAPIAQTGTEAREQRCLVLAERCRIGLRFGQERQYLLIVARRFFPGGRRLRLLPRQHTVADSPLALARLDEVGGEPAGVLRGPRTVQPLQRLPDLTVQAHPAAGGQFLAQRLTDQGMGEAIALAVARRL